MGLSISAWITLSTIAVWVNAYAVARGIFLYILSDSFYNAGGGAGTGINAARARGYVAGTLDGLLRNRRFNMPQGELVDYAFAIDNNHAREDYERILDVVRQWQDQFMEEDLVLLFRRIDYDKIINDIVALPDYYVNTFWHEMVSRLRQRNKVGVKSLLRKSRPLVAALARDMATGAIINMLLGG